MSDIILFAHPTFGVFGIMAALWVLVEAINASPDNARRIKLASTVCAICIAGAWILGGYWYVHFYAPEKAIIVKGPWAWAHNVVMETKEHLFFIPLVLAFYLPIVARGNLVVSKPTRLMTIAVAVLIIGAGLTIEGAGAVINYGVKVAFVHTAMQGAQ